MKKMAQSSASPLPRPWSPVVAPRFFLPAVILLLVAGGFLAFRMATAGNSSKGVSVSEAAIEQRWGIRITQIGVTADGGLVDFRYLVIDPDKALALHSDINNLPVMIAEDSGDVIKSAALMSQHDLVAGRTYFTLYRNTHGAIKSGSRVTVVFGDLRLEHIPAK